MTNTPTRQPGAPFVTIAIPTLNRLGYLKEALASALEQTFEGIEVLVSNNGSTDGTREYLEALSDPKLTVFHQDETIPMVSHWNFLLERAKGRYFVLLSDDDYLDKCFVENCANVYAEHFEISASVSVIYGSTVLVDSCGSVIRTDRNDHLPPLENGIDFVINCYESFRAVTFCSTLYETQHLKDIGGFDASNKYASDSIARARLALRGLVLYAKDAFAFYRFHLDNATIAAFDPACLLDYNLDLFKKVVADMSDDESSELLLNAGLKYCRNEFISQSARENKDGISLKKLNEFIANYLKRFGVSIMFLIDVLRYFRRSYKFKNLKGFI